MILVKRIITRGMLALLVGFSLSAAGLVIASPAKAAKDVQASTDQFRSGGCSGCYFTQVEAALSNFSTVTRIFQGCETGSAIVPDSSGCAGAGTIGGNSHLMDFVVIQGNLKDSNNSANKGLGVPGGATDVTYRFSATGSFRGLRCANGDTDPTTSSLGYLAPEGLDGIPNTADDAGGTGTFGVPGVPTNWLTNPTGTAAVPLVSCTTNLSQYVNALPTAVQPDTSSTTQLCVVQYDADGNGDINNKSDGLPVGSARDETTDLRLTCDMGFSDLPPKDFSDPTFNTQSYANGQTVGAQIFKIVVSNNVYPAGDPGGTTKIQLGLPEIQGLFGGVATGKDTCTWKQAGGSVSNNAAGQIRVCFRENGSGSRETFRNIFMNLAGGQKTQGATIGTFSCTALNEGTASATTYQKDFLQNDTNQDEASCVGGTALNNDPYGAIGYVNAARTQAGMHAVPVFGIDPDAPGNDIRELVKCGLYPYWGPLSGGTGLHAGSTPLSNVYVASHLFALRSQDAFANAADYLPLGGPNTGTVYDKPGTAASYNVKFTPAPGECTGQVAAPVAHP